ncbi:hypothetical protein [Variovorax sp. YR752]|uniref:hypothetical protein n=1 Tax=Variovorax sp. YR752 TaxID=1884383 RepID=UPI003137E970
MAWSFAAVTRWPQPDFLPRPARPPLLAWAALLCMSGVLALAVDEWLVLEAARDEVRAQIERVRPADERRALRAGSRAGATGAQPARGAAEAAQALSRAIEHPWRTLFESSERHAAAGLRWLRLEHDAERGDVRLAGTAPDRRAVLKTLEALAADPGWDDVLLLRIEAPAAGESTGEGVRFELRARLAGAVAADVARGGR